MPWRIPLGEAAGSPVSPFLFDRFSAVYQSTSPTPTNKTKQALPNLALHRRQHPQSNAGMANGDSPHFYTLG
jgi:hypothetical protein